MNNYAKAGLFLASGLVIAGLTPKQSKNRSRLLLPWNLL